MAVEEKLPGTMSVHRPPRFQPYLVRASHPGYCPRYWVTTGAPSRSAEFGDGVVGGLSLLILLPLAAGIDSANGGCCAIVPESVEGTLVEDARCGL